MTTPSLLESSGILLAGRMPFRQGLAAQVPCRLHSPQGEPGLARVVTLAAWIAGRTAINVRCCL